MVSMPPAAAGAAGAQGGFQLTAAAEGRLAAQGPLTFATARLASELGRNAIGTAGGPPLEVDCGGITSSDSAGLAVLLDWLAAAKRSGRKLRYSRIPQGLAALSRISEVEDLLMRGV